MIQFGYKCLYNSYYLVGMFGVVVKSIGFGTNGQGSNLAKVRLLSCTKEVAPEKVALKSCTHTSSSNFFQQTLDGALLKV